MVFLCRMALTKQQRTGHSCLTEKHVGKVSAGFFLFQNRWKQLHSHLHTHTHTHTHTWPWEPVQKNHKQPSKSKNITAHSRRWTGYMYHVHAIKMSKPIPRPHPTWNNLWARWLPNPRHPVLYKPTLRVTAQNRSVVGKVCAQSEGHPARHLLAY